MLTHATDWSSAQCPPVTSTKGTTTSHLDNRLNIVSKNILPGGRVNRVRAGIAVPGAAARTHQGIRGNRVPVWGITLMGSAFTGRLE